MNILLKQLTLSNFKGIKSLAIDFDHITNLWGDNATGKTTIFDAFLWLFFGKDSTDRKDFEIKPLDTRGNAAQKLEVEVNAILDVDGQQIVLKRVLREKWQTTRGTIDPEFRGNETLYFYNDVPLQQKEYQAKIGAILDENIFKLITNTLYFNSLPWQDRRKVLMQICPPVSDQEIAGTNKKFLELLSVMANKTMDEFKRELSARKKKLKDELDLIPARIDEVSKSKPEEHNYEGIELAISGKGELLACIDEEIADTAKANEAMNKRIRAQQDEVHKLKTQLQQLEFNFKTEYNKSANQHTNDLKLKNTEIINLQQQITATEKTIARLKADKSSLETQLSVLRDRWSKINAEQPSWINDVFEFDESLCACPTCKRPFEAADIDAKREELKTNWTADRVQRTKDFSIDKENRLADCTRRAAELKAEIDALTKKITDNGETIWELRNQLSDLQGEERILQEAAQLPAQSFGTALNNNTDHKSLTALLVEREGAIEKPSEQANDFTQRKTAINLEIDELKKILSTRDQREKADKRISELGNQERDLAQQLADLEGQEFTIEQFTRVKIDALESRINSRFKYVRFKLFDTQINGAQVECCDTLINGVPFQDANNAARINAGLSIIDTLQEHYNVYAPVFVDNAESITALRPIDSQVIRLIVSEADKKLRISTVRQPELQTA